MRGYALAAVAALVGAAFQAYLHRLGRPARSAPHAYVVQAEGYGFRAICETCRTPLGEWVGGRDSAFTAAEALAASQATVDFHLWAHH